MYEVTVEIRSDNDLITVLGGYWLDENQANEAMDFLAADIEKLIELARESAIWRSD